LAPGVEGRVMITKDCGVDGFWEEGEVVVDDSNTAAVLRSDGVVVLVMDIHKTSHKILIILDN
jgi:hypothetical protein